MKETHTQCLKTHRACLSAKRWSRQLQHHKELRARRPSLGTHFDALRKWLAGSSRSRFASSESSLSPWCSKWSQNGKKNCFSLIWLNPNSYLEKKTNKRSTWNKLKSHQVWVENPRNAYMLQLKKYTGLLKFTKKTN